MYYRQRKQTHCVSVSQMVYTKVHTVVASLIHGASDEKPCQPASSHPLLLPFTVPQSGVLDVLAHPSTHSIIAPFFCSGLCTTYDCEHRPYPFTVPRPSVIVVPTHPPTPSLPLSLAACCVPLMTASTDLPLHASTHPFKSVSAHPPTPTLTHFLA